MIPLVVGNAAGGIPLVVRDAAGVIPLVVSWCSWQDPIGSSWCSRRDPIGSSWCSRRDPIGSSCCSSVIPLVVRDVSVLTRPCCIPHSCSFIVQNITILTLSGICCDVSTVFLFNRVAQSYNFAHQRYHCLVAHTQTLAQFLHKNVSNITTLAQSWRCCNLRCAVLAVLVFAPQH